MVHFIWRVKKDLTEPLVYAAILGLFLLLRVVWRMRKKPAAVRLSAAT